MATTALPKTCRALRQKVHGETPVVEEVLTPQPFPGAAVVKIEFAPIISYMKRIYDGTRKYPYVTPLTMGSAAIGRIAALPVDSTSLQLGQLVIVDCLIRSRDKPAEAFLLGFHEGFTPGTKKLMEKAWRDSTFAEYAAVPLENCFAVDEARMLGPKAEGGLGYKLEDLSPFLSMAMPFGGLTDVNLRPGETIIIAPATGGFSSGAVKVALAMGAGRVVIMGRNEEKLNRLVAEGGGRVVSVKMTGNLQDEMDGLRKACGKKGEADVFYDLSPPEAFQSTHMKAAIYTLRHSGRVSLMGGQLQDVPLPIVRIMHWNITLKGKWMCERADIDALIQMMERGNLKLRDGENMICKGIFGLDQWEEASTLAEKENGQGFVLLKP